MTRGVTPLRLKAALVVLACIAGLWAARDKALSVERKATDESTSARAILLARAFAERARFFLGETLHARQVVGSHWAESDPKLQAETMMLAASLDLRRARLEVRDATGRLRAGLPAPSAGEGPGPDVPALGLLREGEVWVSNPVRGAEGKWVLRLSTLVVRDGTPVGQVALLLDPHELLDIHGELNLGERDIIALARNDGTLLARVPPLPQGIGKRVPDAGFAQPGAPRSGSMTRVAPLDGVLRKNGWYLPEELPLAFVVGLDLHAAMVTFRQRETRWNIAVGLLGSLLVLTGLLIVRGIEDRERRAAHLQGDKARLEEAVGERGRELKTALETLREREAESRLILDNVNELIVIFRPRNGRMAVVYRSPSFARQFPGEVEEGPAAGPRIHPEDQPRIRREWSELMRRGTQTRSEYRLVLADGSERWMEAQAVVIRDASGRAESAVAVGRDITERKRTERQVQELQRTEAIGQLTGGLAHDFNNLLGVVVGNLDLLGERLPEDPAVQRQYRTALDAALRGAEVTRALLAVARRQPLEVRVEDLNALVAEMLPLLRASVGSAITLSFEPCEGALSAPLDAAGLSNVVLNLALNARDAMKDNSAERRLALRTRREAGMAALEVTDNGCGMSEQVRAQAFEPFFTTKERGKGTGLGLAMVQGYAAQLGGSVALHSAPGQGTTVSLHLPLASPAQASPASPAAPAPAQAATPGAPRLRILVVDDEPELCELACTWLQALGHAATGVHSPAEALQRLPEGFDLLFTDVVMPGPLDGLALAQQAQERFPALRVLIASGYAQSLIDQAHALPGPLLNKPYRKPDLARMLDTLLATPSQRSSTA